jgi:transcriptional regulator with XRE-family HTH domain
MELTAAQCRMARAALQLGVRDLAELAKVSPNTIARLERGEALYPRTAGTIRTALEAAGVEFIAENGGGP